jgi:NTP pyrophosphatase (non-canonical NTP hydrolase)
MTWNEYLELSEKTLSTQFNCDEKDQRVLHAVIGVLTEIEELLDNYTTDNFDVINLGEEVGDVLWYFSILGREYNLAYPQIIVKDKNTEPMKLILKIIKDTCKLLDLLKKKIYYNKPIDEVQFKNITTLLMLNFSDYINCYDLNTEEIFDINIQKLKARYGDKFSTEKAINRDLETERKILSKEV